MMDEASSMRGGDWAIQVNEEASTEATQNWVREMTQKIENLSRSRSRESEQWEKESIYRIPWSVKKLRRSAYQPQMVSIGPYHHGGNNVQLVGMEKHKERAFLNFIERSKKPIQTYMDALMPVVEDLRNAYDQLQPKWKDDSEFLQLMIVDGCFVLELMITDTTDLESWSDLGYAYKHNDKVFSEHGLIHIYPLLKRDMLMLENQLPMKLLTQLVATAEGSIKSHAGLSKLILKFFGRWDKDCHRKDFEGCLHILDLYRKSLILECSPQKKKQKEKQEKKQKEEHKKLKKDEYIRSATELTEAGIRLEESKSSNINDITFRCGALKLPQITVDDNTESDYLNLMAFERLHQEASNEVTSYVFLMDKLIDGAKDVSILHWRGILINALGSDKAVAKLFNTISTDICLDDGSSSLNIVHRNVSGHYRSLLPRWVAYAKHNYFTNPLVTLSVLAATFLFALTGIQTAYTVLGYYNGDNGKNTTLNASKH